MSKLVFNPTQIKSEDSVYVPPPDVDIFIETGTCSGETLSNAVEVFKECHSIECYQPAYLNMVRHFLHSKAKVYFGSSPDVLKFIIDPKKSTLFWLDAHYVPDFGQYKDHGLPVIDSYGQCPLLAELDVIMSFQWESLPYILIDDAHNFSEEFWNAEPDSEDIITINEKRFWRKGLNREDWPTIDKITAKLPKHHLKISANLIMAIPIDKSSKSH